MKFMYHIIANNEWESDCIQDSLYDPDPHNFLQAMSLHYHMYNAIYSHIYTHIYCLLHDLIMFFHKQWAYLIMSTILDAHIYCLLDDIQLPMHHLWLQQGMI